VRLPPTNRVVWFAVLGGAIAWVVQFVANLSLTWAQCNAPAGRGFHVPVHVASVVISAVAIAIGATAMGVSLWLYLYTYQFKHVVIAERRGEGSGPPTGRINFLSVVGLTVNFLALAIMIMTGIGAPLLSVCKQA
jgi:hypothetical protein